MKTVIFPSTYLEPRRAEQMAAVWGPLTLLQPSEDMILPETRKLLECGIIETVYPAGETERLPAALEAFQHWAAQHSGSNLGALLEQGRGIPFFDRQSSAQLVAEIRRGDARPAEDPAEAARRTFFNACLFLCMAQKFDRQQAELAREIAALAAKEREMMALLKGETVATGPSTSSWRMTSPGEAMLDLRLKSWALVMSATRLATDEGAVPEAGMLFLADSPEVMARVRERVPEMVPRLRSALPIQESSLVAEVLPAWLQAALRRVPKDAIRTRDPVISVDLIEIPATSAAAFLARLAGRRPSAAPSSSGGQSGKSSWVGCMAPL